MWMISGSRRNSGPVIHNPKEELVKDARAERALSAATR